MVEAREAENGLFRFRQVFVRILMLERHIITRSVIDTGSERSATIIEGKLPLTGPTKMCRTFGCRYSYD
jgi:hypothetical protein